MCRLHVQSRRRQDEEQRAAANSHAGREAEMSSSSPGAASARAPHPPARPPCRYLALAPAELLQLLERCLLKWLWKRLSRGSGNPRMPGELRGQQTAAHSPWAAAHHLGGSVWTIATHIKNGLPSNHTFWYLPKVVKNLCSHKSCTQIKFIAALFIIAKTWKQPRCPSVGEWINKLWYIQTMDYYSALKRNTLSSHEKAWRKLKCVLLKTNLERLHTI